jgi:putative nucleotidyltransferase with HDIG domain
MDMDAFWHHCLCTGVIAKLIAVKQGVDSALHEEYFVAGLLHDIGKIPLNGILSADYSEIINTAGVLHEPLYIKEKNIFKLNHCTTGEMIVNKWNLSGSIADVIVYHHSAAEYSGGNVNILYNVIIANYFSQVFEMGFSGDRTPIKPENRIWEVSGLKEDYFPEIKEIVIKEIEKARIFLNT